MQITTLAALELAKAKAEVEAVFAPAKLNIYVDSMEADIAEMPGDGQIVVRLVDEQNGLFGAELVRQERSHKTLTGLPKADVLAAVRALLERQHFAGLRLLE